MSRIHGDANANSLRSMLLGVSDLSLSSVTFGGVMECEPTWHGEWVNLLVTVAMRGRHGDSAETAEWMCSGCRSRVRSRAGGCRSRR